MILFAARLFVWLCCQIDEVVFLICSLLKAYLELEVEMFHCAQHLRQYCILRGED